MQSNARLTDKLHRMPLGQPAEVWSVQGDLRLGVKLADLDRLGCLLKKLEMKPVSGINLEIDPERTAETISYLGEPLCVVESEEARGRSVLRSHRPRKEPNRISFYEMILDRVEGLCLVRYAYDRRQNKRSPIAAPMTREVLDRLLHDVVSLAGE